MEVYEIWSSEYPLAREPGIAGCEVYLDHGMFISTTRGLSAAVANGVMTLGVLKAERGAIFDLARTWPEVWARRRYRVVDVVKPKYERSWKFVEALLQEEGKRWKSTWCSVFLEVGGGKEVGVLTGGEWFPDVQRGCETRKDHFVGVDGDGYDREAVGDGPVVLESGDGRSFATTMDILGRFAFFQAAVRFAEAARQDTIKLTLGSDVISVVLRWAEHDILGDIGIKRLLSVLTTCIELNFRYMRNAVVKSIYSSVKGEADMKELESIICFEPDEQDDQILRMRARAAREWARRGGKDREVWNVVEYVVRTLHELQKGEGGESYTSNRDGSLERDINEIKIF